MQALLIYIAGQLEKDPVTGVVFLVREDGSRQPVLMTMKTGHPAVFDKRKKEWVPVPGRVLFE